MVEYKVDLLNLAILLYMYKHCPPTHSSNSIIKIAHDTKVVELILGRDESEYLDTVEQLSVHFRKSNLALNTTKTKELVIEFSWKKNDPCASVGTLMRGSSIELLGRAAEPSLHHHLQTDTSCLNKMQNNYFMHVFLPSCITMIVYFQVLKIIQLVQKPAAHLLTRTNIQDHISPILACPALAQLNSE